jgi:hypothetical protein
LRSRVTHNLLAWCLWLLAPLLLLQPAQRPLSADGAPSIGSRPTSDCVIRPQHASLIVRAAHRDRPSGNNDAGPDFSSATIPYPLAGWNLVATVPTPIAIGSVRDFLSRRTAYPRAPPA